MSLLKERACRYLGESEWKRQLLSDERRPMRLHAHSDGWILYGDRGNRCVYKIHSEKGENQVGCSRCIDSEHLWLRGLYPWL